MDANQSDLWRKEAMGGKILWILTDHIFHNPYQTFLTIFIYISWLLTRLSSAFARWGSLILFLEWMYRGLRHRSVFCKWMWRVLFTGRFLLKFWWDGCFAFGSRMKWVAVEKFGCLLPAVDIECDWDSVVVGDFQWQQLEKSEFGCWCRHLCKGWTRQIGGDLCCWLLMRFLSHHRYIFNSSSIILYHYAVLCSQHKKGNNIK